MSSSSQDSLPPDTNHHHPLHILLLICFLLIPLLYKLSPTFRFVIRILAYYATVFVVAWIGAFICIAYCGSHKGTDMIFVLFKHVVRWTGIRVVLRDRERLDSSTPIVIVSNHQSSLDIMVMAHAWPRDCTVMMKKSLRYIPGFNIAAAFSHAIYVDRFNHENAQRSLQACVDAMMRRNLKVWVFPEGTRNHRVGLLPFKKGAFNVAVQAKIPIVPVVISSYHPFYSKPDRYFHDHGYIIVQLTSEDVPQLADEVRQKMLVVYEKISAEAAIEFAACK